MSGRREEGKDMVTVERRVLIAAIGREYMMEHREDLRVTVEDADAFARRVVDNIPEHARDIEREKWA